MFFRKFIWLFAIFLLFGALFASGRQNNAYHDGYAQGYVAGQQSVIAEDGTTAVTPPQQPVPPTPYRGTGFLGVIVKLFTFFFGFMLLIGLMGMLFGRKHWRHHRRHRHGWHQEWHGRPPRWDDDDLKDEPIMKA